MLEPMLINKILTIPVSHTKLQVHFLLGLINFYSHNLRYSDLVACLTNLTKTTGDSNKWLCHSATLRAVQDVLNSKPWLKLPDLSKDFILFTDASSIGLSVNLCKMYD